MEKEILYTTARDKNGNLIHINNAEKGVDYYCPLCNKDFILRKSGKTGRSSKRPHFAHNELTPNCTPEGVLHYSFKKLLVGILEKYKSENKPFIFNWDCVSCGYKNLGNLLEKVTLIKEEYVLGERRPDIALLDKEENVLGVIEVVVTHKPEERALQYYKENKTTLIQMNLTPEEDLNKVEERVKNPDIVDLCFSPKCQNYDRDKIKRKVQAHSHQCGRCPSNIPRFEIEVDSIFGKQSSRDFTEDEIHSVKSWGKLKGYEIATASDPHTKGKYPVFVCENCKVIRSRYNRFRRF